MRRLAVTHALRAAALLLCLGLALPAAADDAAEEARARDYFTDTPLLTQDGKTVRFYSDVLKGDAGGRTVVLSFLFSRCKTACPLLVQKLNQVRAGLDGRLGKDVFFVSISVDPGFDTPAALKTFAKKQRATGPGWLFLTGKPDDVATVLKKLGSFAPDVEMHSTAFIAGNTRTRRWTKIAPHEPPAAVAQRVLGLADGQLPTASPAAP